MGDTRGRARQRPRRRIVDRARAGSRVALGHTTTDGVVINVFVTWDVTTPFRLGYRVSVINNCLRTRAASYRKLKERTDGDYFRDVCDMCRQLISDRLPRRSFNPLNPLSCYSLSDLWDMHTQEKELQLQDATS